MTNSAMREPEWDVFISHASEDKAAIVAPIAQSLRRFGLRVWYDEFTLSVGDSLSRSIDRGLARSRFGLVVLSPNFFAKDWPEYELRGLTAKELGRDKVILPLWHNVTRDDVIRFSPPLADKVAIVTQGFTPIEISVKVVEVVSPELFERIHRRLAYLQAGRAASVEMVNAETLYESPIRHKELPKDQIQRIRLLRAALLDVRPMTMQDWIDGFRRDMHPADEILIWEHYASVFVEVSSFLKLSADKRKQLYLLLATAMQGADAEDIAKAAKPFTKREFAVALASLQSDLPVLEFVLDPTRKPSPHTGKDRRRIAAKRVDIADGNSDPHDLPAELIEELLKGK